jgi:sugar/nucleoside kinase (ribokinase family)
LTAPILCLGEILVDLIAPPNETLATAASFAIREGGAPLNAAVALARLGVPVRFAGAVGDDPFGRRLRALVIREGVDDRALRSIPGETTSLAYAWRDERGDGHFHLVRLADRLLNADDVERAAVGSAAAILVGSVSMAASPSREAILAAVDEASRADVPVVFDVNVRPTLWATTKDLRRACEPILRATTVLKLSLDDAVHLWGTTTAAEVLERVRSYSPRVVVVTDGSRGVYRLDPVSGAIDQISVFPVEAIDPTGAGDAFTAALVSRLAANGWELPSDDDIRFAMAAGALATTRQGAMSALPTRDDLQGFLETLDSSGG